MAGCNTVAVRSSCRSDVYFGRCGRARAQLLVDYPCVNAFIHVLNFCSQSQPRNYFNSEIFPIYGTLYRSNEGALQYNTEITFFSS